MGSSFASGARAAIGVPPLMVLVAMIGFGSLARSQNIDLFSTLFTAAAIYGLPGQVAMLELYATGATAIAVIAGVSMANMRFFPMAIVLMPQLSSDDRSYWWRYLAVQVMSINSWTHTMDILPTLKPGERLGFFSGFGFICFLGGLVGSSIGWFAAYYFSTAVTVTLVFLNPAYFIYLFCCNTRPSIVASLIAGSLLGPPLYLLSPELGLPLCGLLAGTIGFWFPRLAGLSE